MDSITLENFRCFYKEQTVPLKPLTLLVGDNSTGKTSFMAMIRILWDTIYRREGPNFNEEPFELGTFNDITHRRGGQAEFFYAGFEHNNYKFGVRFEKRGTEPVLTSKKVSNTNNSILQQIKSGTHSTIVSTPNGIWEMKRSTRHPDILEGLPRFNLRYFASNLDELQQNFKPIKNSPSISQEDWKRLLPLDRYTSNPFIARRNSNKRPYAGAPVRSKPRRTYDPETVKMDPEGDYVPMYLARQSIGDGKDWQRIKNSIEEFGIKSGILDNIQIKHLGDENEPFRILIRKGGQGKKGSWKNLKDVGYGISQILPLLTYIFREDSSGTYLLQQPEIHLHPSAQVTLATLFCQLAKKSRQFIIETHSDFIIDRVRMEVRDGLIKPKDVSLLFFERQGLDVKIHPIEFDKEGNVLKTPAGYRKFFLDELDRSLWKRDR